MADALLNKWTRKQGSKRKQCGRRSSWNSDIVNDLIGIIVSCEVDVKTKLIFENTKRIANTKLYDDILKELNQCATDRGKLAHTMLHNCETSSSYVRVCVCVRVKRMP